MAHAHEKVIRDLDEAQARGDFQAMFSAFTEDVVAHFAGRSKLAGDYKGRDQLQDLFGRMIGSLGTVTKIETHDIVAGPSHGIQLNVVTAERGGETIELHHIDIFHFTNRKISEAWFGSEDQYAADEWYDAGL